MNRVYVLLFKIDGIDSVRVFSSSKKAFAFYKVISGPSKVFIETIDRGMNEIKETTAAEINQMKCPKCGKGMTPCDRHMECIYCGNEER
jgi:hypothetical protein